MDDFEERLDFLLLDEAPGRMQRRVPGRDHPPVQEVRVDDVAAGRRMGLMSALVGM
jgi:hypothetical protein